MANSDQQNITCDLVEQENFEIELSETDVITVEFKTVEYIPHRKSLYSLTDTEFVDLENNQIISYNSVTGKWENKNLEDVAIDATFIYNEVPTKLSATKFQTVNDYRTETLRIFLNGVKLTSNDYTKLPSNKFTLGISTLPTDKVEVNYILDA